MTIYIRHGSSIKLADEKDMGIIDVIPPGNFSVVLDGFGNPFLSERDPFAAPPKYYGDVLYKVDRILNTFKDRPEGTGVLLSGTKGSGKTMLAKAISTIGAEKLGYPTLLVTEALVGENFRSFIRSIEQPVIVMFDEFEKVYSDENQQEILTLLDGAFSSKKLFVVTCNDLWRINENMLNRPGRFFYSLEYRGLDETFVREYCQDNLNDKDMIERVVDFSTAFRDCNFDILKALVEEMNRYSEDINQALRFLNISSRGEKHQYEVVSAEITRSKLEGAGNKKIVSLTFDRLVNEGDEINLECDVYVYVRGWDTEMTDREAESHLREMRKGVGNIFTSDGDTKVKVPQNTFYDLLQFTASDIVDITKKTVTYKSQDGVLTLRRLPAKREDYYGPSF